MIWLPWVSPSTMFPGVELQGKSSSPRVSSAATGREGGSRSAWNSTPTGAPQARFYPCRIILTASGIHSCAYLLRVRKPDRRPPRHDGEMFYPPIFVFTPRNVSKALFQNAEPPLAN